MYLSYLILDMLLYCQKNWEILTESKYTKQPWIIYLIKFKLKSQEPKKGPTADYTSAQVQVLDATYSATRLCWFPVIYAFWQRCSDREQTWNHNLAGVQRQSMARQIKYKILPWIQREGSFLYLKGNTDVICRCSARTFVFSSLLNHSLSHIMLFPI